MIYYRNRTSGKVYHEKGEADRAYRAGDIIEAWDKSPILNDEIMICVWYPGNRVVSCDEYGNEMKI